MKFLIPIEQLRAANAKYERELAAKESPAPRFKYQPRSKAQWFARMDQKREIAPLIEPDTHTIAVEPLSVTGNDPEPEENESGDEMPAKKLSGSTLCVCGCRRDLHCLGDPIQHWPMSEGAFGYFSCVAEHCTGMKMVDGKHVDCNCLYFRASESATSKLKRPRANDFKNCAACGHWRIRHCRKRSAPKKGAKPKKKEIAWTDNGMAKQEWRGYADEHGQAAPCKHTPEDASIEYQCSSTSCAEENCPCEKFINLLAKPRITRPRITRPRAKAASPRKPSAPRKSRNKQVTQLELFGEPLNL